MSWTVAGVDVPVQTDIELTASTLSLSFQVSSSELATWRDIGDRAGDLTVETGAGGALRTLGRGSGGTVVVTPGAAESPPVATGEWYVDEFDEEQVAPDRFEVALDFQRPSNRRDEFPLDDIDVATMDSGFGVNFGRSFGAPDDPPQGFGRSFGSSFGVGGGAPLSLALNAGDGVTIRPSDSQLGQLGREGAPTGADVTMPLIFSAEQAAALADAAGYPDGVVEQSVPDDDSVKIDESGGRQTVGIKTRGDIALDDGDWLLTDWSIEWNSHSAGRRWMAELELTKTAD